MKDRNLTGPEQELAQGGGARPEDEPGDMDDTARVPNITRMPEGYEVVEHRLVHATAQWVLHVRCQCGRRWFELEAIDATHCPRCGVLVYIDIQEPARDMGE